MRHLCLSSLALSTRSEAQQAPRSTLSPGRIGVSSRLGSQYLRERGRANLGVGGCAYETRGGILGGSRAGNGPLACLVSLPSSLHNSNKHSCADGCPMSTCRSSAVLRGGVPVVGLLPQQDAAGQEQHRHVQLGYREGRNRQNVSGDASASSQARGPQKPAAFQRCQAARRISAAPRWKAQIRGLERHLCQAWRKPGIWTLAPSQQRWQGPSQRLSSFATPPPSAALQAQRHAARAEPLARTSVLSGCCPSGGSGAWTRSPAASAPLVHPSGLSAPGKMLATIEGCCARLRSPQPVL